MVQCVSHPHGDTDGTVHVAFTQPAMLGDATFLGSQGGSILQRTERSFTALTDDVHSQRGENISLSLYQESEIITELFWWLVRERLGRFQSPQRLASVRRSPLMLQSETMQSSTWCSSASVQTARGRLNKQWPNQINIYTLPCKAKTNGL